MFDFNIGKEYRYDEKGNRVETIDHDKGYEFTAADVINYCLRQRIPLEVDKSGHSSTRISRGTNSLGETLWTIEYGTGRVTTVQLDAKTGEIIRTKTEEIVDDLPTLKAN